MTYNYSFEKLDVWQKAREITNDIYRITKSYPDNEKFGLVSQLRRAAVSVASNIAEGSGRKSQKEKGRFYQIAQSSAFEVVNQLIISNDLGLCSDEDYKVVRHKIEIMTHWLYKLIHSTGYSILSEPIVMYTSIDEEIAE